MAIPSNIKTLLSGDVVEWARIEYKETWNPAAFLNTVCAFANALDNWGGGYIVIGVKEENGCPVYPLEGIPIDKLDAYQKDIFAKYGIISTKEMDMVPNMASSFIGAKIVYSGDLVFNKLKAHLGVFAVSQHDGLVSPDYAVYYAKGIVEVKYLEYLFKTPQYIAEFRKNSSGVGAGLT